MQDKLINFDELSKFLNGNRSLGTISPVPNISGPTTTLFYDLRGSATYTSCPSLAMGTLDRWRIDPNDPLPLNRDQWIFWTTGTATLVRILEMEKYAIPNHWTNRLPLNEIEYPSWTINLVEKCLKEMKFFDNDQ